MNIEKATKFVSSAAKPNTICAVATANGGAIGIIRISGNDAIGIADKVFKCAGKPLRERSANTVTFGRMASPKGEVVDEVLVNSELSAKDNKMLVDAINRHWKFINEQITKTFNGERTTVKNIENKNSVCAR